jgi:hypothetical protein
MMGLSGFWFVCRKPVGLHGTDACLATFPIVIAGLDPAIQG